MAHNDRSCLGPADQGEGAFHRRRNGLEVIRSAFGGPDVTPWLDEPVASNILDTSTSIKQHMTLLDETIRSAQSLELSLRAHTNNLSRPHLTRGLRITDMPQEILVQIFELIEDLIEPDSKIAGPPKYKSRRSPRGRGWETIRSCRLTCRRFSEVAAQMLFRHLTIRPRLRDMALLEKISCHPIMSKSVCTVQVGLEWYDPRVCRDIETFSRYCSHILGGELALYDREQGSYAASEYSIAQARNTRRVLAFCRPFAELERIVKPEHEDDGEDGGEHKMHLAHLNEAFARYQQFCEEQESLVHDGTFANSIASAMAKMPHARHLMFDTSARRMAYLDWFGLSVEDLYTKITRPITGALANKHELGPPILLGLVPQVLGAVGDSETSVEALSFCLYTRGRSGDLLPDHGTGEKIQSAIPQLRYLSFIESEPSLPADLSNYEAFLWPYADAADLETLEIKCGNEVYMGGLLTCKPRQALRSISLEHISFHIAEFLNLLATTPPAFRYFQLGECRLLTGTWALILEVLRHKSFPPFRLFAAPIWAPRGGGTRSPLGSY